MWDSDLDLFHLQLYHYNKGWTEGTIMVQELWDHGQTTDPYNPWFVWPDGNVRRSFQCLTELKSGNNIFSGVTVSLGAKPMFTTAVSPTYMVQTHNDNNHNPVSNINNESWQILGTHPRVKRQHLSPQGRSRPWSLTYSLWNLWLHNTFLKS